MIPLLLLAACAQDPKLPEGAVSRWDESGTASFCLDFSPDGKSIAVGHHTGIKILDPETGKKKAEFKGRGAHFIVYSTDGKLVIGANQSGEVRVLDAADAEEVRVLNPSTQGMIAAFVTSDGKVLCHPGPNARIWNLATGESLLPAPPKFVRLLASGTFLAVHSGDFGKNGVTLWNAATGRRVGMWATEFNAPTHLTSDGARLIWAGTRLRVSDAKTGKVLKSFDAPGLPDSLTLVSDTALGSRAAFLDLETGRGCSAEQPMGKEVTICDLPSGTERLRLRGHTDRITSFTVFAQGKRAATRSQDKTLRCWDTERGTSLWSATVEAGTTNWTITIASPDGTRVITATPGSGMVQVFDAETGKALWSQRLKEAESRVEWNTNLGRWIDPASKVILFPAVTGARTSLRALDLASGRTLFQIEEPWSVIQFSSDGSRFVGGEPMAKIRRVFETSTGKELAKFEASEQLVLAPDGRSFYRFGPDTAVVRVLDVVTGKETKTLHDGVDFRVLAMAEQKGKILIASKSENGVELREYDPELPKPVGRFDFDFDRAAVAITPDGKYSAIARANETKVSLIEVATGKIVFSSDGEGSGRLSFSADGKLLISSGRTLALWETATGKKLLEQSCSASAVSPDGKLAAILLGDTFALWDVASGKKRAERKVSSPRGAVDFSPDGLRVATLEIVGGITVWDVERLK